MKLYKSIITLILLFLSLMASAQDVEMADKFRSDGKIYNVIIVVLILLTGIFVYLFMLDRKVNAIEKKIKK